MMLTRRMVLAGLAGIGAAAGAVTATQPTYRLQTAAEPWAQKLIAAGEAQIGETVSYDPAYVKIGYPGGDVPRDRGVCTDVVIRAYRDGLGVDLQKLVHEDMKRNFAAYPAHWGLKQADANIDHRRVPNLETFFKSKGAALPVTQEAADYQPGDLVSMRLGGRLPHIVIVSARANEERTRALCIHNIGAGTRLEDVLFAFDLSGHFRLAPSLL
jgi:hypothetical protein